MNLKKDSDVIRKYHPEKVLAKKQEERHKSLPINVTG